MATGGQDDTIRLWNVESGRASRVIEAPSSYIKSVAYSPNGKLIAAGGGDGRTILWDAVGGTKLRTLGSVTSPDGCCGVYSVAFSPDGTMLAVGGASTTITLWEVP